MSGSHFNEFKETNEPSFAELIKKIGGRIPNGDESVDHWITIHDGYSVKQSKPGLVLGQNAAPAQVQVKPAASSGLNLSSLKK